MITDRNPHFFHRSDLLIFESQIEIARQLVRQGASPDFVNLPVSQDNVLVNSIKLSRTNTVDAMLSVPSADLRPAISRRDKSGCTAFHHATMYLPLVRFEHVYHTLSPVIG
jgi:ankyrin repeat protein